MNSTEAPSPTLIERATFAYEADVAEQKDRQAETDARDFLNIKKFLDVLGITPTGDTFRNPYDGLLCVPIIDAEDTRTWNDDGPDGCYRPAVAVTIRDGQAWVMAEHQEEPQQGFLLPVGELTGLEVIGRAIQNGGHRPYTAPTIDDQIRRALTSGANYATGDGEAFLAAADAICIALRDLADAIRNPSR